MAYPPSVPPDDRVNSDPLVDDHPGDHNLISAALTDIINELGGGPKGAEADLTARLATFGLADDVTENGPVGMGALYFGASAPNSKWLLCQGQAISRTTYATLFARIGTAYGTGNGTTTFNLPDMRSVFPVGLGSASWSNALNEQGGSATSVAPHTHEHSHTHTDGSLAVDINHDHSSFNVAMPAHTHTDGVGGNFVMTGTGGDGPTNVPASGGGGASYTYSHQSVTGGFPGSAPNIAVNVPALGVTSKSVVGTTAAPNESTTGAASAAATNGNLVPYITVNFIVKALA